MNPDGSKRNVKILVFVDSNYMEMFLNWYKFFNIACNDDKSSLEIICMDITCSSILADYEVDVSRHSFRLEYHDAKEKLGTVWSKRMEVVSNYLSSGTDLVLTDADALWLKDPFVSLQKMVDTSDIVASRGWWPWPLFHEWGACVCMGFVYIKATTFSRDLLSNVAAILHTQAAEYAYQLEQGSVSNTTVKPDDQLAINYLLYKWNITWQEGRMNVENNTTPSHGVVLRNDSAHFVTLLQQHHFVRNCHNQSLSWGRRTSRLHQEVRRNLKQAIVAHCRVATGDSRTKRMYFKTFQLWKVAINEFNPQHYNISNNPVGSSEDDKAIRRVNVKPGHVLTQEAQMKRIRERHAQKLKDTARLANARANRDTNRDSDRKSLKYQVMLPVPTSSGSGSTPASTGSSSSLGQKRQRQER